MNRKSMWTKVFCTVVAVMVFGALIVTSDPASEISTEPVQTRFGWHVIRLNETRLIEAPTLDELRGQIVEQIQQQAIETRVTELTEGAEITRSGTDVIDPALLDDLSLLGE